MMQAGMGIIESRMERPASASLRQMGAYNERLVTEERLAGMSGENGTNGKRIGTISPHDISSEGIPKLRQEWIARRREEGQRSGDGNMTQMHFARKGLV